MSTLGQKPATQHVSTEKQTITGNGGTSYTLQQSVGSALDVAVFVNNTRQEPTTAYSASGTTLTMTGAVNSSDHFYVIFLGKAITTTGLPVDAVGTANINANAVTTAKLHDDAVTHVKLPSGSVLQVVQNTSTSAHSGTATDWASTGFSVAITPSFASSKVLLNVNAVLSASANAVQPRFTIFRGSTNLGDAGRGFGQTYSASGGLYQSMVSTTFLDSPNTTSATTYTVYLRTNQGTYVWGADSGTQTFVAQEIAA